MAVAAQGPGPPVGMTRPMELTGSSTGKGVRLAVIDSGVNTLHPGISPTVHSLIVREENHRARCHEALPVDKIGHGTACANIIRGYAPDVEIWSIRIFLERLAAPTRFLVEGIRWCVEHGMHLANISLGTTEEQDFPHLEQICWEACKNDIVLVAADHARGCVSYPAHLPSVIGVGAMKTGDGGRYVYQSSGSVQFYGRGDRQLVAWSHPQYAWKRGSSLAAAHITGRAALIKEERPDASLEEVCGVLIANAAQQCADPEERR